MRCVLYCGVCMHGGTLTATKVPGRKTMVMTEMVFMAELSRLLAAAIRRES
jgi:hypothetical protein